MHIVKGMIVKVISGNHKGQSGKVLDVFPKKMGLTEKIMFLPDFDEKVKMR